MDGTVRGTGPYVVSTPPQLDLLLLPLLSRHGTLVSGARQPRRQDEGVRCLCLTSSSSHNRLQHRAKFTAAQDGCVCHAGNEWAPLFPLQPALLM